MAYIEQIIGNNLKKYRKIKKLTLEKVADKIGINHQNLSKVENGRGFVKAETFEKLCEVLEISPSELVSIESGLPEKIADESAIKPLLHLMINELDDSKANAFYKLALAFLEAAK